MLKPGRPTKQDSEDLTARMVAVATRMFLERGYAGTTIDELAQRLGATKRSVYSRCADKAELFRLVTTRYAQEAIGRLAPLVVDDRPLVEQLHGACRDVLRMFLEPDVIAMERVVVAEAGRFPEITPILEAARLRAMERLYPILRQLAPASTDDALREWAQMLWDLVIAAPVRAAALGLWPEQTALALDRFIARRIALFLDGLSSLSDAADGPHDHLAGRPTCR